MDPRELEFFRRKINSAIDKASQGGVVLTSFLDETKIGIVKEMTSKIKDISVTFSEEFKNAEYRRALFQGVHLKVQDFKTKVYEIVYNKKYLTPHHRMILGTLMGFGIKRESLGDIVLFENGGVFFSCTEEISPYLIEHFKMISKHSIDLKEVAGIIEIEKKFELKTAFVASLRLDVILSAAYHLSRSTAQQLIVDGLVQVNHMPTLNYSLLLKENDLLSVRHKGRVYLKGIGGTTRSSRLMIELAYQC